MQRASRHLLNSLLTLLGVATGVSAEQPTFDAAAAGRFIEQYCLDCHNADDAQAGLNLAGFSGAESLAGARPKWQKIVRRVKQHEMPPPEMDHPPLEERSAFTDWVAATLHEQICGDGVWRGPAPIRRLNKSEYRATIRDLLGVHFDAAYALPDDGAGGEGFDNAAETLFLSPLHAEMYLEAAKQALAYAAKDSRAQQVIFNGQPTPDLSVNDAARQVVERFALRAFRRPPAPEEIDALLMLFMAARGSQQSFEEAVLYALQGALVSPNFLFRVEERSKSDQPEPLNDYEFATRLSYFLWGSTPDDKLFELAGEGKLRDEAVLREQMVRMLKDEKSRGLAESFMGQWLGIRRLGVEKKPNSDVFPEFNYELEDGMRQEPIRFFQEILAEDLSLMTLIDADFTYANKALARLYEIDKTAGKEINEWTIRLPLPEESPRGGVLTMAGVLATTSYPHRTSPVLRGKWVLETMLGAGPPLPPPEVPALPEEPQETAVTLRARLEQHRADATCAACHKLMDPVGFCLENFDAIGRWRTEDSGQPIDATGELPSGERCDGPEGLKNLLLERKDDFVRHFTTKLLGYALGRGLVDKDYCEVDRIAKALQDSDYKAQTLVWGIITSPPFTMRGN